MSLATRCTHCGTIFRVVQDQLKISEGWVRCGRCQEVFSALEGLFDLEREAPPQRVEKPSATELAAQGAVDFVTTHHPLPTDFAGDFPREPAEAPPLTPAGPRIDSEDDDEIYIDGQRQGSLLGELENDAIDLDLGRVEPSFSEDTPAVGPLADDLRDAGQEAEDDAATAATSSFLGADPVARSLWHRPAARASLSALAVVLVAGLLLQVALQFRDVFASQWPESRGALEALCESTGCKIEPMRRLAAVSVEASGLTQVQGADAYRLNITLHNRSAFDVAVPSIDLSLTDGAGGLVARRALSPSDFSAAPELVLAGSNRVLAPGAEVQLQTLLASRAARITGYNVELFYP
jgi:predicted Zn finger-like uncharacterized protein